MFLEYTLYDEYAINDSEDDSGARTDKASQT